MVLEGGRSGTEGQTEEVKEKGLYPINLFVYKPRAVKTELYKNDMGLLGCL